MCGRFTLRKPLNVLLREFGIAPNQLTFDALNPRYNIAPTQQVAMVVIDNGQRQLTRMRWGLIPFWQKDLKAGPPLINARMETVADKPAFRQAFHERRGLMLADGFFEWKKTPDASNLSLFGRRFAILGCAWLAVPKPTAQDAPRNCAGESGRRLIPLIQSGQLLQICSSWGSVTLAMSGQNSIHVA